MEFRHAEVYNENTRNWDRVDANNLTEADRNRKYRCLICGAEAYLVINKNKNNCFRSMHHLKWCGIYKPIKKVTINEGNVCKLEKFLKPKPHVNSYKKNDSNNFGGKHIKIEDYEEGNKIIELNPRQRLVTTLSGILRLISENEIILDKEDGCNIQELIINCTVLESIKINKPESFNGIMKLEKGKVSKIGLENIKNRIWLKDIQSNDDENAVRISAAVVGQKDNELFLDRVYGNFLINNEEKRNIKVYIIGHFERKSNMIDPVLTYDIDLDRSAYVIESDAPDLGDLFFE